MSTCLRTALTATLALSAVIVIAELNPVRAEASSLNCHSGVSQVERRESPLYAPIRFARPFVEPLQASFDPEPTPPPTVTGGSGTR